MTGSLDQNFDLKKDELSWRTVAGLKRAATWLKLSGYVDAAARPVILEAFKSVSGNVLVDFAAVRRINSMGVATLIKACKDASERGCEVRFVNLSELNVKIFQMTGLLTLGTIVASVEEAKTTY